MNEMFQNVRSELASGSLPSVPTPDLYGDLLANLKGRNTGTKLERRLTELERVQISERIKEARVQAGLTQEELADLLHVRSRTVANYEAGRVPWRLLGQIAEATGKSQEWLLHGDRAEPATQPAPIAVMQEALENQQAMRENYEQLLGRLESLEGKADDLARGMKAALELLEGLQTGRRSAAK